MPASQPPQPVPGTTPRKSPQSNQLGVPSSSRTGASPMSYGAMTGISFSNGGGFSFDKGGKMSSVNGSYGARFYNDGGIISPSQPFSTSITMEPSSFAMSSAAFHLPSASLSSSFRRSYADATRGTPRDSPRALATSFASMSFQPMSFGTSYSKSHLQQLMSSRTDAELTKSYFCCGIHLDGLHALVEHCEDVHPEGGPPEDPSLSPLAQVIDLAHGMDLDLEGVDESLPLDEGSNGDSARSSMSPKPVPTYLIPTSKPPSPQEQPPSVTPLSISEILASPPDMGSSSSFATRSGSTASSPLDGSSLVTPATSAHPSPVFSAPKIVPARSGSAFLASGVSNARPGAQQKLFERAFNDVVAGKQEEEYRDDDVESIGIELPTAVAPTVLFASNSANPLPPTPTATAPPKEGESAADADKNKSTDPTLPQPSLFSTHRPWRCPNPGCNKSYKQSNGLKYHQQKGQCDYAVKDAVEHGLTVEQAEERNRPFVCAVGAGCTKRYRQMNGLKYHYLNSGEHGQYGLRMLANNTHPQPPSAPSPPPKRPLGSGMMTPPRPGGAPYAIPSQLAKAGTPNSTGPRMGTWPSTPRPNGAAATPTPTRPGMVQGQGATSSPTPTKAPQPKAKIAALQPIQRGPDAVLFAAPDDMDILGRSG